MPSGMVWAVPLNQEPAREFGRSGLKNRTCKGPSISSSSPGTAHPLLPTPFQQSPSHEPHGIGSPTEELCSSLLHADSWISEQRRVPLWWASTDRLELPCPGTQLAPHMNARLAHPKEKTFHAGLHCPLLGCPKCGAGLPPEQSWLLLCQPGAWAEDLCCLHPPAPTCLTLATVWFSALIPADCSDLFKVFGVLVGGGRRGTAARPSKE